MKRVNKEGPAILGSFHVPPRMDASALSGLIARKALVIDTRPPLQYAAGHLDGTINIPLNASFVTWAGWLVRQDEFYLIVDAATAASRLPELARSLALIGIDRITGYFDASVVTAQRSIPQIAAADVAARLGEFTVIDVRNATEWATGHLPGAIHIPLGYLTDRLADIPTARPIVVQCQSGNRSAVGASILERHGFSNVSNLTGGITAWAAANLPIEHTDAVTAGR